MFIVKIWLEGKVVKLSPLQLGSHVIETPVILAPMAGITNSAFRKLCREYGAGLYVSEMVTSRALLERTPESMRLIKHDSDEKIRSVQLYGVDAKIVGAAVRMLVSENRADHIDLNFGCPVAKVTRRGGGAALPWKLDLFKLIVETAVLEAGRGNVPITVKMRKGIDGDHLTYVEAAKIARDSGVAAITLHGRTAADFYSGKADWDAIANLCEIISDIPILGNGDIWSADDAVRMVEQTGVSGVVIGRGCQGRPWLFADLMAAFSGSSKRFHPNLLQVCESVYRHAQLLVEYFGDELQAMRDLRKHMAWYFKGYVVGSSLRAALSRVVSLENLQDLLGQLDVSGVYPGVSVEQPRGRAGSAKRVVLPQGWLVSRNVDFENEQDLAAAELGISGG